VWPLYPPLCRVADEAVAAPILRYEAPRELALFLATHTLPKPRPVRQDDGEEEQEEGEAEGGAKGRCGGC
jgi:hypothetical protein